MSYNDKKLCISENYIEHFFLSASVVTGCTLLSAFASLLSISIGIESSAIGSKTHKKVSINDSEKEEQTW